MRSAFRTLLALLPLALATAAFAVDTTDTRLLSDPAISARHIAFVYAGDVWVAGRDGSGARRVTSHAGTEASPRFSPDGSMVAFSGTYDGNIDVYTVPVTGGEPTRLTWHPGTDRVQGFTPDGSAVLFTSQRTVHTRRFAKLYTVPVAGGFPTELPIPHAARGSYSGDGEKIAYNPLGDRFRQWKGYRGGTASRIWIYDTADHGVVEVPRPAERSNDVEPMWLGADVYFLSDRAGEINLFRFAAASGQVEQITEHDQFGIEHASTDGQTIIYEQAGWLHSLEPATGASTRLQVAVGADLTETRARWASGADYIRGASISPSGARAVLAFRGEIVTVPAKKGDVRNLTQSPGAHDQEPAWSPDGASVAYVSDASGENQLVVAPQDGKGEPKAYDLEGAGFYEDLQWSPDGTHISYTDNAFTLYVLELATGSVRKVAAEPVYGPFKRLTHHWSPNSHWLAYTLTTTTYTRQVWLYDLENGSAHPVSDGLSDVAEPVFDQSGKYLYFRASTDAGPALTWFAMSNADVDVTNTLYVAVLGADEPSPLAKESDEEPVAESGDEAAKGDQDSDDEAEEPAKEKADDPIVVDFDGLDQRILALPVEVASYGSLTPGDEGQLYYLKGTHDGAFGQSPGNSLVRFDLSSREETTLLEGAAGFTLSEDHKKILVVTDGGSWHLAAAGGKIDAGKSRLDVSAIQVRVDPRAEWNQIYHEAWRINRDYFYDPGMHGADWPAMREKYAQFLPHLADREDLNRVLRWLSSELAVGHHRVGGGDDLVSRDRISGGLLGADFAIESGRYRFAEVYGGLNWNPDLRAPLTEPGVGVQAGEFLLAVNGTELVAPDNLFRHFENTAGQIVSLTVGPSPSHEGSRTVEVVPIENEAALRNRAWVEGNLQKVHEATDGRVAYVYVPDTSIGGHSYFKRYFFPQADKQAIIVDERYNGGGQIADYYIDILRRPLISWWATRYGQDFKTPLASIQGPKVMIIDETAGSGGDMLPWMFRKLEIGPLVGKATWGGLVGILGFPTLMDGGGITAPNLAIWTEDGFIVENVGVPPDIEVEQYPADVIAGRDPQLEKAIETALEMLEAAPPVTPTRPPFPVRALPGSRAESN